MLTSAVPPFEFVMSKPTAITLMAPTVVPVLLDISEMGKSAQVKLY